MFRRIHVPALVSVLVAGTLVFVGGVRFLSYPGSAVAKVLQGSILRPLTYQPSDYLNLQYFKILATLSAVSLMYFLFRIMNRYSAVVLDFRSAGLRLVLITIVSIHWIVIEVVKFRHDSLGMYSPSEAWSINIFVLLASNVIAFLGMKHLSFDPLLKHPEGPAS